MDNPTIPRNKNLLLKQYHLRWASTLDSEQSPEEAYQERLEEARANYQDAARTYDRGGSVAVGLSNEDSSADAFEVVFGFANEYKRVRDEKEAVRQQEYEYQQQLMAARKSMLRELLDILGQPVCDQVIVEWTAVQQALLTPMREEADGELQPTNTTADFPSSPVLNSVQQPSTAALPTMSSPPDADEARNPDVSPNEPQPPTESDLLVRQEERETRSRSSLSRATNHVQRGTRRGPPLTDRTIEFDQVYQNGNAACKYVIDEFRGRYYIVECKKHNLHFTSEEAIKGARRHLQGKRHNPSANKRGITFAMAIAEFGTEVSPCNLDDKKLNNKVAIIANNRKRNRMVSHPNTHQSRTSHIYPQVGEVYKAFWRSDRRFYAVLILPSDPNLNFSQCLIPGWDTTLKHTDLFRRSNRPPYYKQQQQGNWSLELPEDYKAGGPKESKRKYPVVFFHKGKSLTGSNLGWIAVSDLETYDPADESIEYGHRQQAKWYLLERDSARNAAIQETNEENVPSPTTQTAKPDGLPDRLTSEHHPCREVEQRETEERKSPEPPFVDALDVLASDVDDVPTHQSPDRPPYDQSGDEMDIDGQVDNASHDTMITPEGGTGHEERQALLEAAYSLTDTTRLTGAYLEVDDVPMSDDTQTSRIYTHVPVSPSSAAAQAQAALEGVLARHSSAPEATPRNHYSPSHASQSPLPISLEPYNVERDADDDSLASNAQAPTDLFEVSQSTSVAQRTLHGLCYRLNGLTTIEEHGGPPETDRSDGGTMRTSAQTPDGSLTRVLHSSCPPHRRRRRRPVSCFIPRRR